MTPAAEAGTGVGPVLRLHRVFDYPRDAVFDAWTDARLLVRWFAPHGCTLLVRRLDIHPGGGFHLCVRNPAFGDCWTIGTFLEIVRPERLVFTSAIADANGVPATPESQGHDPGWPAETIVRVTFAEHGTQTRVTLEQNVDEALARRTGAYAGWAQMLDRLERQLAAARP